MHPPHQWEPLCAAGLARRQHQDGDGCEDGIRTCAPCPLRAFIPFLLESGIESGCASLRAAGTNPNLAGVTELVVVPISFVFEHMGTLNEMDREFAALAAQNGITTCAGTDSISQPSEGARVGVGRRGVA